MRIASSRFQSSNEYVGGYSIIAEEASSPYSDHCIFRESLGLVKGRAIEFDEYGLVPVTQKVAGARSFMTGRPYEDKSEGQPELGDSLESLGAAAREISPVEEQRGAAVCSA